MRAAMILVFLCFLLPLTPASAKKPEKENQRDGGALVGIDVDMDVVFSPEQRDVVRNYQHAQYGRGHCPPGLAKKNNGCLPPGQAKKRFAVGRPLPPGIVVLDLPGDLQVRLGKPPRGARYGIIDGDVVKLVAGSLLVVDAIDGLTD